VSHPINEEAEERIHSAEDLDVMEPESPAKEFVKFQVSRDPYIAPYLASDEVLAKMPPVSMITCSLDPCLDDMVMFGKRLKFLKHPVTLDVLEGGLPHGFLNFCRISKEARNGSFKSAERIKQLLDGELDLGKPVQN
jgi:hormone-sensitive lipase